MGLGGVRRLDGFQVVEDGPIVGLHSRDRRRFGTRHLDEVPDVAEAEPRPGAGPCAFGIDRHRFADAASCDRTAEVAVAAHLLGHRKRLQARLVGRRPDRGRVAGHRVEVNDRAVGRDASGLMEGYGLLNQCGIATAENVEEH